MVGARYEYSPKPYHDGPWEIIEESGECFDIALTRRFHLAEAGWPLGALRPAFYAEDNAAEVVLVLVTNHGDYVLRHASSEVIPWGSLSGLWGGRVAVGDRWQLITI